MLTKVMIQRLIEPYLHLIQFTMPVSGATYYYVLTSVDASGDESVNSKRVSGTPLEPTDMDEKNDDEVSVPIEDNDSGDRDAEDLIEDTDKSDSTSDSDEKNIKDADDDADSQTGSGTLGITDGEKEKCFISIL
jgi:hypothetical protein